jgi:hypothetical protein
MGWLTDVCRPPDLLLFNLEKARRFNAQNPRESVERIKLQVGASALDFCNSRLRHAKFVGQTPLRISPLDTQTHDILRHDKAAPKIPLGLRELRDVIAECREQILRPSTLMLSHLALLLSVLEETASVFFYGITNVVQPSSPLYIPLGDDPADPQVACRCPIVPEEKKTIPAAPEVTNLSDARLATKNLDRFRVGGELPSVLLYLLDQPRQGHRALGILLRNAAELTFSCRAEANLTSVTHAPSRPVIISSSVYHKQVPQFYGEAMRD